MEQLLFLDKALLLLSKNISYVKVPIFLITFRTIFYYSFVFYTKSYTDHFRNKSTNQAVHDESNAEIEGLDKKFAEF